jgi:hypothetical protein
MLLDDDPALSWRNLELLGEQSDTDKLIVIVRMRTRELADLANYPPEIYIPIAA